MSTSNANYLNLQTGGTHGDSDRYLATVDSARLNGNNAADVVGTKGYMTTRASNIFNGADRLAQGMQQFVTEPNSRISFMATQPNSLKKCHDEQAARPLMASASCHLLKDGTMTPNKAFTRLINGRTKIKAIGARTQRRMIMQKQ